LLVDIVVRKHEVVAAKPTKEIVPPIILVRTESGSVLPSIKWSGSETSNYSGSGLEERLQLRVFGKLKGAALKEAYRIVRDNGGLDISGESVSLEVQDTDFEVLSLSLSLS
jgi:hypothetical protein